jgi:hypothetical protein
VRPKTKREVAAIAKIGTGEQPAKNRKGGLIYEKVSYRHRYFTGFDFGFVYSGMHR